MGERTHSTRAERSNGGEEEDPVDAVGPELRGAGGSAIQADGGDVVRLVAGEGAAIRSGIKAVAMTIVAADLILAGVVGLFCFLRLIGMQRVGLAMLVSVVLSAALVVVVVMPALLRSMGERLWYFPSWLRWLPHVTSDDRAIRAAYAQGPELASGD